MQIREIGLVAFCAAVLVISFVAFGIIGGSPAQIYPSEYNKVITNSARILCDFTISILFFGFGGIIAMFIEGMNIGVAFASKKLELTDILMILPIVISIYSGVCIGKAILRDYKGSGTVHEVLSESILYLIAALIIAVILGVLSYGIL